MAYKAIIHPAFYKTFPTSFKELLAENELWIRFGLHYYMSFDGSLISICPCWLLLHIIHHMTSDTLSWDASATYVSFCAFHHEGKCFLDCCFLVSPNDNYYTLESGILILASLHPILRNTLRILIRNWKIAHKIEREIMPIFHSNFSENFTRWRGPSCLKSALWF